jgi:NO-binding membrane sensor protein with MHYT domain/two-component sensor histidine kinase
VLHHSHGLTFVGLAVLVAVVGSWTALDLFRRVRSHFGAARRNWLAAAALAMGVAIWSMHFIAMLGFDPGSPVRYDPGLTALSLALAVGSTGGAFFAAGRETAGTWRYLVSGIAMGLGICLMHYVGMAALRTAVSLGYDPLWVAASVVVAVVASTTALFAARQEQATGRRAAAAVILGLAIVGMHYTAMAALKIAPGEAALAEQAGAPPFALAIGVAAGTTAILGLALIASLYDQRTDVLSALEAGEVGYWELTFPAMTLQSSPRAKAIMGRRETDPPIAYDAFVELLDPADRYTREQLFERLQQGGSEWRREYRLKADGRAIAVRGRLLRDATGRPRRMLGVILDVTESRRAFEAVAESERRQKLLIEELNHRVKNTLATVQSLALQTAKRSGTVDEFRKSLEQRLIALSRTHDALTRGRWESASLRDLVAAELKPYAHEQVRLDGPELQIGPREALSLGMTFHELATNAAKYGALSVPSGCVTVRWAVDDGDEPQVRVVWTESEGPRVQPSGRVGFGSRLIDSSVRHELRGTVERRLEPTGMVCEIRFPHGRAHR